MKTALLVVAVAVGSSLVTLAAVLWRWVPRIERHFVFRPSRWVLRAPSHLGIPWEQHWVETDDGCRLSAWHMCPPRPRAGVVYFHGNGSNLSLMTEVFAILYRIGFQVFAVDYRGYGHSDGTPTEDGVYRDAEATARYFRERLESDGVPTLYWGRSLGSIFAAWAAREVEPDGLVVESGFASVDRLVGDGVKMRLYRLFSRTRLDALDSLRGHRFPVLVVHGDRDRTIPLEEGRYLYERLDGPKELYVVEGADHISTHMLDTPGYARRVLRFVDGLGAGADAPAPSGRVLKSPAAPDLSAPRSP